MRRATQRGFSIPSEPWEQKSLAPYFALVSVLLLASMVWALWDEVYTRRPWKSYQKQFFALARRKYVSDKAAAAKALKSDEYKQAKKEFEAAQKRYENNPEVKRAQAETKELDKQLAEVRSQLQLKRGDYQATIYDMEHETSPAKKDRLYQIVARMEPTVNELTAKMEVLQDKKKKQQDKLIALAQGKMDVEKKLAKFERQMREAELGLEGLQKEKVTVRQVFNNELKIVDRCQSCHVAADRKGFDDPKKFKPPFRSHPPVFFLPAPEKTEEIGKSGNEGNPKSEIQNPKSAEPPRLLDILTVHPVEQFGCAVCHRGQGFAASSVRDAHGELEFVLTPLLRGEFAQATCLKCHQQETELKGAPVLNEGRRLAVEYGCIGCHTFAQLTPEEANRQVAPDLHEIRKKLITPEWLVNWIQEPKKFRPTTKMPYFYLTREQATQIASYLWQNARKPDTETPPPASFPPNVVEAGDTLMEGVGCFACHSIYGKKGEGDFAPNLSRIGEKMRYDYMVSWLMDPRKHQPEGRMPRLRLTQQEASHIAAYLTTKKSAIRNPQSAINLDDPVAARQGKELIKRYGCFGCHKIEGMEGMSKIGAELSQFGSKAVELLDYGLLEEEVLHHVGLHNARDNVAVARIAWVEQKLRDPRSYDKGRYKKPQDKLRMPKPNLTAKQIRAVVTFLMGLTDEKIPPNWQRQLDEREAAVAKGLRIIRRQNCIGCHQFQLETLTFTRSGENHRLEGLTKLVEQGVTYFQLWKTVPGLKDMQGQEQGNASNTVPVPDPDPERKIPDKILIRTEGWGGNVAPFIIDQWVKKANLAAEEARAYTPPLLVGEGRKAQPPWLFNFLKEPIPLRPWLQVRMPTFVLSDEDAAAMVRYFAAADGGTFPYRRLEEREPSYVAAKRQVLPDYFERTRKMVDVEAQCGSCHVRGAQKPEGDPSNWAPDLALAQQRLQPEWIIGWLKNPQELYPGTKMPTFPWDSFEQFPGSPDKKIQAVKDLLMTGQIAMPLVASAKR